MRRLYYILGGLLVVAFLVTCYSVAKAEVPEKIDQGYVITLADTTLICKLGPLDQATTVGWQELQCQEVGAEWKDCLGQYNTGDFICKE